MFSFIKKSIKIQLILLFSVIFLFNVIAIIVLANGWSYNSSCSKDVEDKIIQSQEISSITAAHVSWVENLRSNLEDDITFTGSFDPDTCSFGKWLSSLNINLRDDEVIAGAITSIIEPHKLIHNQASEIIELNKIDHDAAIMELDRIILPNVMTIITNLNIIADRCNELAVNSVDFSTLQLQNNSIIQLMIIVLVLIVSIIIAIFIINITVKPTILITTAAEKLAKGELDIQIDIKSQSEIGRMAASLNKAINLINSYIRDISNNLNLMSRGDMRIVVDMDYIGDFATIKQAILYTTSTLNNTLLSINTAVEQVSAGSSQVASGADELAAGSTEQASSIEELSASITKIADQADENSSNVKIATKFVEEAGAGVNSGNEYMKHLTEAMANIGSSSNRIASITKVIEEIAFQTNILALNASIEAARAGSAGKGFMVVADEVRHLAAKSTEAAKQTAELIQLSVKTVAEGVELTTQTAQILQDVGVKANKVVESIMKIEHATAEQAIAIDQIKQGITQVSSVVQNNAATAEENSATSEELSAQAATLRDEVGKFILFNMKDRENLKSNKFIKNPQRTM